MTPGRLGSLAVLPRAGWPIGRPTMGRLDLLATLPRAGLGRRLCNHGHTWPTGCPTMGRLGPLALGSMVALPRGGLAVGGLAGGNSIEEDGWSWWLGLMVQFGSEDLSWLLFFFQDWSWQQVVVDSPYAKIQKFLGKRLSPLSAPYVRISHFLTGIFDRKSLLAVLKFERINRMSPLIEYSIFFKRVYQETS